MIMTRIALIALLLSAGLARSAMAQSTSDRDICDPSKIAINGQCIQIFSARTMPLSAGSQTIETCKPGSVLVTIGNGVAACAVVDTLTKPEGK
ncbi:MAG: hypothetical protein P4L76_13370 [Beijerinckiaceae bacterium]|nr:hypothetical protein [Beijerinckiaceae bacterium]